MGGKEGVKEGGGEGGGGGGKEGGEANVLRNSKRTAYSPCVNVDMSSWLMKTSSHLCVANSRQLRWFPRIMAAAETVTQVYETARHILWYQEFHSPRSSYSL